jgi:hypothetical protein
MNDPTRANRAIRFKIRTANQGPEREECQNFTARAADLRAKELELKPTDLSRCPDEKFPSFSESENYRRKPFRQAQGRELVEGQREQSRLGFESPRSLFSPVGPILWDGEHRFPNNVCPEKLSPTKAWQIHPIKLLAER